MRCKLCEDGNVSNIIIDNLRVLDLREKKHGFREFFMECETVELGVRVPMERFTVVLGDGRKGTVLVQRINGFNPQRVLLSGEGELE